MLKIAKCLGLCVGLMFTLTLAGCSEKTSRKPASPPADEKAVTELPPPVVPSSQPESSLPPEAPATKPVEALPASTYDSKPPYPVDLYVRTPQDEQPGWLKILDLADKDALATTKGTFPEQNKMVVDTQNVERIQIHIGHLPMAEKKRITLRIDNQGIELVRNKRNFVTLIRRPTGEWVVEPPPKD
jgi:hypothetical protein